jgi:hypothetical protein
VTKIDAREGDSGRRLTQPPARQRPGVFPVRGRTLLLVAAVVLLATSCGSAPSGQPPGTLTLKVTPSKAQYASSEQIVLSVAITNGTKVDCQVLGVPEGGLAVASLTRDAVPVIPTIRTGEPTIPFPDYLAAHLVRLGPGSATQFDWVSSQSTITQNQPALIASSVAAFGQSRDSFWTIKAPGTYTLMVRYSFPDQSAATKGPCVFSGLPATAAFAVTGS